MRLTLAMLAVVFGAVFLLPRHARPQEGPGGGAPDAVVLTA